MPLCGWIPDYCMDDPSIDIIKFESLDVDPFRISLGPEGDKET